MADSGQTKSESASPRRRDDARKRGQVATSSDLASGLYLLLMLGCLSYSASYIGRYLAALITTDTSIMLSRPEWSIDRTVTLGWAAAGFLLNALGPFLAAGLVLGVLGYVLQVGFHVSPEALAFKPSRLSLGTGSKRIFSIRGVVRTGLSCLKFLACSVAMFAVAFAQRDSLLVPSLDVGSVISNGWQLGILVGLAGAFAVAVIGLGDFAFQRWQHEEDLKMTKQEVKDETKENEGDPQVRRRIRKLQAEAANLRTLNDVPRASVVVTNPTHFAVALYYEEGSRAAPKVVAKGADLMAKRIRSRAEAAGVPIVERKEVARFLYATTSVGSEIPATIYRAVAEIMGYVYRLRGRV